MYNWHDFTACVESSNDPFGYGAPGFLYIHPHNHVNGEFYSSFFNRYNLVQYKYLSCHNPDIYITKQPANLLPLEKSTNWVVYWYTYWSFK